VNAQSASSVKVVIDVMLKAEILDPQGQAIANALPRMGFSLNPVSTRQGKRFEFTFDHVPTEVEIAEIKKAAETLLANPVIETFEIRMEH
jgi:phosphoribosylformylglycinamidine synthase